MSKKLKIKLEDWDYSCSDGCCYMYGTSISLNGEESDNNYDGGSVEQSLEFVLNKLGFDVEFDNNHVELTSLTDLKNKINEIEQNHKNK